MDKSATLILSTITSIELVYMLSILLLIISAIIIFILNKRSKGLKKELHQSREESKKLSSKVEWNEILVEQLIFLVDNIPEGIVTIDSNFEITFYNKTFSKCLNDYTDQKENNLFDVLGFAKEDQTSLIETLKAEDAVRFTWLNPKEEVIHNVRIRRVSHQHANLEYGVVLEDITYFKEEEKKLIESLENKKKELIAKMMQISKRNSDLEAILSSLQEFYRNSNSTSKLKLSKIISKLNDALDIEDGWETFNTYFHEIQPLFLEKLKNKAPSLSNNDIRHCTYIKLGLNNKEIADMLHISLKTVETTHYRIKKKLDLPKEEALRNFITEEF